MATPTSSPGSDVARLARQVGLVYQLDTRPGLRRRKSGRGFVYVDARNRRVTNPATIERIRKLAIPPAYSDVWICTLASGHLQATGRDARGRKQYRYHARWRSTRDVGKFDKLVPFAQRLPHLRRALRRDLALPALPETKVLAVIVSLLSQTWMRVGNEEYAQQNGSYGLTTLRDRHVSFLRQGRALLRFRGKSGQRHEVAIDDTRLVRLLRRCQQLPGQMLFQYVDDAGMRRPVDSGLVNDYLREVMGDDFTAKDFRTWGGTVCAIAQLARTPLPESASESAYASAIAAVVREVAARLRNTPAVCRGSYIHPGVFDAWRSGRLQALVAPEVAHRPRQLEQAALKILRRFSAAQRRR